MVRAIGLAIGLLLFGASSVVAVANKAPGTHLAILPFTHTDGVATTVFTVTNISDVSAAYQPGFYMRTGGSGDFPYRLIYQDSTRVLDPGVSDSFSTALYEPLWTEPADTLVVRSDMPVSVTQAVLDTPMVTTHNVWLPIYAKWEPGPAPGISPDIYEYKFVDEGKCYPHWVGGEWIPICEDDEVRYEIAVVTPMAVRAMWMLRPGDAENGERVQMWRSAAETAGYVIFRPGFSGSVTVVPAELEYTIGTDIFRDAYDVDCAWTAGSGKPACWDIDIPD